MLNSVGNNIFLLCLVHIFLSSFAAKERFYPIFSFKQRVFHNEDWSLQILYAPEVKGENSQEIIQRVYPPPTQNTESPSWCPVVIRCCLNWVVLDVNFYIDILCNLMLPDLEYGPTLPYETILNPSSVIL